jgi:hypothetical protein
MFRLVPLSVHPLPPGAATFAAFTRGSVLILFFVFLLWAGGQHVQAQEPPQRLPPPLQAKVPLHPPSSPLPRQQHEHQDAPVGSIPSSAFRRALPHSRDRRFRRPHPSVQETDLPTSASILSWSRFRAVTVVHEPCSTLAFTLTNFAGNLGPDWPILVLYTPAAESAVVDNKIVRYLSRYGSLTTLPLSALGIPGVLNLASVAQYSRLLTHPDFWLALHAEKALIFQVDSVLCSGSTSTIDDFLAYDYIGAPWIHAGDIVGNGGLSLRSVDKMLYIARHYDGDAHPEDVFFVEGLAILAKDDHAIVRAPHAVARQFAFEMGEMPTGHVPFSIHRSDIVPNATKAALTKVCPDAQVGVWTSCGRQSVVG